VHIFVKSGSIYVKPRPGSYCTQFVECISSADMYLIICNYLVGP